jgi:hypothetical protein
VDSHPTVNYKKGCTRLAAKSDKVYQLLAYGQCFSSGTPASSTTKTGRHDIAESGVKHNKSNQYNVLCGQEKLFMSHVLKMFEFFACVILPCVYMYMYVM